ncbi:MAG TPA: hypothetical protein VE969_07490 [Pyrinomonadaceae bacterium]|nr:hypothetical protein [Pyrinomonadaceae bacterium]
MMAISRKEVWPQTLRSTVAPIKYLTENGFSIVRESDVDHSVHNSPSDCRFLVQHDDETPHEIHVSFSTRLIIELKIRRRRPLSEASIFWLVCAETCLANYLWEYDQLPPNHSLAIDELAPEELMLALHWRDRE